MIDITRSIKACAEYYGENSNAMESYLIEGEKKALELNNRGPIKFDSNGNLYVQKLERLILIMVFIYLKMLLIQTELKDIKDDLEN